ncbi:MAG: hypothetical protein ACLPVW_05280 [Terriglobales bacterium]
MSGDYLRRYTDLTALIYLLRKRKLTLLDPSSWDDSNDSYYLRLYKEKRKLRSVLALCFTETDERYHYWRVFAPGASGVCVRFNRSGLLAAGKRHASLQMKPVTYLKLDEIRRRKLKTAELPFLKRYAFLHESEVRMIYESRKRKLRKLDISIPLSCIDRVTLSPWMHPSLSSYVKEVLRSIDGCRHLDIVRSTLIGNEEWKSLGENAK